MTFYPFPLLLMHEEKDQACSMGNQESGPSTTDENSCCLGNNCDVAGLLCS